MLKKILIRLLLLAVILSVFNFVYERTMYPKDLAEKSKELIALKETQPHTDIYYFGESSNITYKPGDSIQNSISELAGSFYPGLKFTNVNKYATHGGVYRNWLRAFNTDARLPQAIIVTLNLRSFNAAWIHSDLETQLQESLVFSRPFPAIVNRFMLSLQAFDNKTVAQREEEMLENWRTVPLKFPYPHKYRTVSEWDYAMSQGTYLKADGSWYMDKIILACHYVKGYAFNINEHNPRITDFDAIYKWCGRYGVKLYLNLMAENVQYADSLVGKDLVFLMKQNRDFLLRRYHHEHCKVIDNLEVVPGRNFIDQNWTTEHYDYKGRMKIARNLADTLKYQFKQQYKKAY